jgi:hypothetical protein
MTMTEARRRWFAVKGIPRAHYRPSSTADGQRWVPVQSRPRNRRSDPSRSDPSRSDPSRSEEPPPEAPRDVPHVEIVDAASPAAPMVRELHPLSRAIRISRVTTANGRRRWSVDFLVRHHREVRR